jgi:hypothetical protein
VSYNRLPEHNLTDAEIDRIIDEKEAAFQAEIESELRQEPAEEEVSVVTRLKGATSAMLVNLDAQIYGIQQNLLDNNGQLVRAVAHAEQEHRDSIEAADKVLASKKALASNGHSIEEARLEKLLKEATLGRDAIQTAHDRLGKGAI